MNSPTESSFLVIPPLIERHVGDAAFYWAQHDRSAHSPLIPLDELHRFNCLLDAHLDGIRVAGDAGWQLASDALHRWQSAAEVFVCAVLAFERADELRQAEVMAAVERDPQRLLRGLISAMLWLPRNRAQHWLQAWVQPEQSVWLQTAAWRMLALAPQWLRETVNTHGLWMRTIQHSEAHLRAAACRAAVHMDNTDKVLQNALFDAATMVVVEAAIALQRRGQLHGRDPLSAAVLQLNAQAESLGVYDKKQALHRLSRWVRYLALAYAPGAPELEPLLEVLPPRLMLEFILHHGDAGLLPLVIEQMHHPECARLAGWVWSSLTGVDLQANGLMLWPETPDELRDYPTNALDAGLPMPNAYAIAQYSAAYEEGAPILLGRPLSSLDWHHVWHTAPQALRWIVAQRTGATHLNNRAHGREQRFSAMPLH